MNFFGRRSVVLVREGPAILGSSRMIDQRIESAVRSNDPVNELRNLAFRLLAEGQKREAILELLERARQQLRQAGRDADEDARDGRDGCFGWLVQPAHEAASRATDLRRNELTVHSAQVSAVRAPITAAPRRRD
jgi:hypothetical protein